MSSASGVTVNSSGAIEGNDDGMKVGDDATITTSGTVTGATDDGIDLDYGSVTNSGVAKGFNAAIEVDGNNPTMITNTGTLDGGTQGIIRAGSTSDITLNLGSGTDKFSSQDIALSSHEGYCFPCFMGIKNLSLTLRGP